MSFDVHELSGSYAVDALDDDERAFFERHLSHCERCLHEVAELREAVATMAYADAEAPPPRLRTAVLEQVADTAQDRERPQQRRGLVLATAVAALVVMVGGLSVVLTQTLDRLDETTLDQVAMLDLLTAPDAAILDLDAPEGAVLRLVWSAERDEALLVGDGLARAPDEHGYALWTIHDEVPVLAGWVSPDEDGVVGHHVSGSVTGAQIVAITVERERDIDAPTTEPIVVGELG